MRLVRDRSPPKERAWVEFVKRTGFLNPSHIVPLSPALLVAAANAFIGVSEQGGDDHRQMVELYSRTRWRFIHTGIVVGVLDEERVHERDVHVCVTVEGNTNTDGSSNGHTTLRNVRTFREADGHRFVRWAEMVRKVVVA